MSSDPARRTQILSSEQASLIAQATRFGKDSIALVIQLRWARTQIQRLQGTMHSIFPSAIPTGETTPNQS